ncbi:MAG TPA: 2-oxoglutarate dehydrogenase E1 component [Gemmatimonadaceae bacterium]|nr:2-oxoglutarate dehydrogenase E1 component [Gemmatimonadaceae bacterium]
MTSLPITSVFNDGYIAEVYESFRRDPASVDESWRQFFRFAEQIARVADGPRPSALGQQPASTAEGRGPRAAADVVFLRKVSGAASLLAAIRQYGHLAVQLDPLGAPPPGAAELTAEFHGISEADLADVPAAALVVDAQGTAADVVQHLRELYCGPLGIEFEHIEEEAERFWFRETIEGGSLTQPLAAEERLAVLQRLTEVDGLERFLGKAFPNAKRFSIEGLDVLVPVLDAAIEDAGATGTRHVVIGMAHRGRLNVLAHILGKPYGTIFQEFAGRHHETNAASETGDVKYHLGYRGQRQLASAAESESHGETVDVQLVPNPSHLEFVNPVMNGVARALQRAYPTPEGGRDERSVLPICVHGDAAFPGEGVVAETLNMSRLRGFRVGGTLHVIANNQVGFTTDPIDARSTHYSSDLAKGFEVPVIHVNADDAEACVIAARLAVAYRQRFAKDVVIDLVGYRRHGHNEADQPAFTQPRMYELIRAHPTPREVWAARLVRERVTTEDAVATMEREQQELLAARHREALQEGAPHDQTDGDETGMHEPGPLARPVETAVRAEQLVQLNEQLLQWPSDFKLHQTLQRTLPRRRDALQNGGIDWGHAEALAFASLLVEGHAVRLTGQDAERGTFSHRQAVLHDVQTGGTFTPLQHLPNARAAFELFNSPLSETAVMGFEYGFSTAAPEDLVLWEAQFGDFANTAQPIIDQFLVADRAKWGLDSGLVLLLPHGYEGQGPEHSSARLERFLQLAAEENMVVAYPSTPAQYFHLLRRHAKRAAQGVRRPMVLMQPKSLLRLPQAASRLEDLAGSGWMPVMNDPRAAERRPEVRRLVFCSGKIFYDLAGAEPGAQVALVRVEELYPWPHEAIAAIVDQYPNVEEVVWAQEEPRNMGGWTYVAPRLRVSTGNQLAVRYVGRPERASPAEGYKSTHDAEQARIVAEAIGAGAARTAV